jgi:phage virion morphogenesis protein
MAIEEKIRIEDRAVRAALQRLRLSLPTGGSMKPAFTSIGRIVKTGTQRRFRQQRTPEGVRWKPSQRVEREGGQTLRLSGRLQRSYTYQADESSVEIGSNVVYAGIQHFGGMAGRGHHSRIDPRPALGASEDDKEEIADSLNGFLGKRWSG